MDPRKPHDELPILLKSYPFVWGVASSATHLDDPSKLIVIINLEKPDKLAFARPGDVSWTLIVKKIGRPRGSYKEIEQMSDIILFKEHFYAIDYDGRLYQCDDIRGNDPKIIVVASFEFLDRVTNPRYSYQWCYYLVESLGNLFLLVRTVAFTKAKAEEILKRLESQQQDPKWRNQDFSYDLEYSDEGEDNDPECSEYWDIVDDEVPSQEQKVDYSNYRFEDHLGYRTINFEVFKVDMYVRKWVEVKNLGDSAFVLGWHTSFSVSAPHINNGYKPNCIYFIDDCNEDQKSGGHDNGVFCIEDGSIESIYSHPAEFYGLVPVLLWFNLIPS